MSKAKIFQKAMFFRQHFFLPKVPKVQSGNGVLNRLVQGLRPWLVPYIKLHETSLLSTPGQFGAVLLP